MAMANATKLDGALILKLFKAANDEAGGALGDGEARHFFARSGLSQECVSRILGLASYGAGKLSISQFGSALHLVSLAQAYGGQLPACDIEDDDAACVFAAMGRSQHVPRLNGLEHLGIPPALVDTGPTGPADSGGPPGAKPCGSNSSSAVVQLESTSSAGASASADASSIHTFSTSGVTSAAQAGNRRSIPTQDNSQPCNEPSVRLDSASAHGPQNRYTIDKETQTQPDMAEQTTMVLALQQRHVEWLNRMDANASAPPSEDDSQQQEEEVNLNAMTAEAECTGSPARPEVYVELAPKEPVSVPEPGSVASTSDGSTVHISMVQEATAAEPLAMAAQMIKPPASPAVQLAQTPQRPAAKSTTQHSGRPTVNDDLVLALLVQQQAEHEASLARQWQQQRGSLNRQQRQLLSDADLMAHEEHDYVGQSTPQRSRTAIARWLEQHQLLQAYNGDDGGSLTTAGRRDQEDRRGSTDTRPKHAAVIQQQHSIQADRELALRLQEEEIRRQQQAAPLARQRSSQSQQSQSIYRRRKDAASSSSASGSSFSPARHAGKPRSGDGRTLQSQGSSGSTQTRLSASGIQRHLKCKPKAEESKCVIC